MTNDKAIAHLESIRHDIRDEIKRRIEQRDKYSIQLTIALGAIVALSFSTTGFRIAIVAAPLVSIYFTVLILYSYRIHRILAHYLRDNIEPTLARLCGTPPEIEWETYYAAHAVPGIRRRFFLFALWVVSLGSAGYLWIAGREQSDFELRVALVVASVIYILVAAVVTRAFWEN